MSDDPSPAARPVAVVVVDSGLAHLDHPFEYAVPPELDTVAVPGVRVRVRFAGRDVDGFVVERRAIAEHPGRLTALRRVVSPEPVLTQRLLVTARAVADHYGGTLSDVLRLAVPKRHAAAELDGRQQRAHGVFKVGVQVLEHKGLDADHVKRR